MNLYFVINREQLESGIHPQKKLLSELSTREKIPMSHRNYFIPFSLFMQPIGSGFLFGRKWNLPWRSEVPGYKVHRAITLALLFVLQIEGRIRPACKWGQIIVWSECFLIKTAILSLTSSCSCEHESISPFSARNLKMMLKSKQVKGIHKETQGTSLFVSMSWVSSLNVLIKASVYQVFMWDVWFPPFELMCSIVKCPWPVKNSTKVITAWSTELQSSVISWRTGG